MFSNRYIGELYNFAVLIDDKFWLAAATKNRDIRVPLEFIAIVLAAPYIYIKC